MATELGVNIDHVATLREARGGGYPNPVDAAIICDRLNVDGITIHLREDRRHIQDADVFEIKKAISCKLNLEMALSEDVIAIARNVRPEMITLVPEKREELTTEGGLDVASHFDKIESLIKEFKGYGTIVSLFIEPEKNVVDKSIEAGADFVEFHTGAYAEAQGDEIKKELSRLYEASEYAVEKGIRVNAGHGLNYDNVEPILKMKGLEELNIGHSIVARSIFVGMENAVKQMQELLR